VRLECFTGGGRGVLYARVDNSVKMIANGGRLVSRTRFNRESPTHRRQTSTRPCASTSRSGAVGPRDPARSALLRPVYGPYIGRESAARLITLSRMIYSVAGPPGVAIVAADVRPPVAAVVTCRHLSRRPPGPRASSMPARRRKS